MLAGGRVGREAPLRAGRGHVWRVRVARTQRVAMGGAVRLQCARHDVAIRCGLGAALRCHGNEGQNRCRSRRVQLRVFAFETRRHARRCDGLSPFARGGVHFLRFFVLRAQQPELLQEL